MADIKFITDSYRITDLDLWEVALVQPAAPGGDVIVVARYRLVQDNGEHFGAPRERVLPLTAAQQTQANAIYAAVKNSSVAYESGQPR